MKTLATAALKEAIYSLFFVTLIGFASYAFADSTATTAVIDIPMITNLTETLKSLLNGKVALVIDGIILLISAYAAGVGRSPAPLILGIMSCAIFHVAVKLFLS